MQDPCAAMLPPGFDIRREIIDQDAVCLRKGYDLVCVLPVGIAESEPSAPQKKDFHERAWFNAFKGI